jgi:putative colanic acid biosynthesis glycosyltransferase WcaI
MKILYLSQYFPPEMGAPSARVHECAREWVAAGMEVTVLTGMPHHPTGVVPPKYRKRFYVRENIDGIDVARAYVYATPNRGIIRRAWSYITFMICSICVGLTRVRRADVLIATSPQLLAGLAGWILSAFKRVPFVFEVRDLWPESIEAVGALRSKFVLAPLYAIANFLYRRAKHIVVVSDTTKQILIERGIPESKITVIKNGVDLDLFAPQSHDNEMRERHHLNGEFVILYIGTIGMAHALEVVVEAAERLKDDDSVKFLLVGEGARKAALVEAARNLPNLIFVDGRPREEVPAYLAASDVCLVHLRRSELFETVLPSKMFEIMGCARPILLGVEGEALRTMNEADAGVSFSPEDSRALIEQISRLQTDRAELDRLGRNGRQYAEEHYCRRRLARRYAELLEGVAK